MSLQVWLPLTKDLRQQGLSNITITNSGATYSATGGKLGGCYVFDGSDDSIGIGNLSTLVNTDFTFACWFYHDDTWSSKNYETIFGGPSGFELETKNGSTQSPVIRAYSWGGSTFTYELNKWNHLVMTRTTSETKFYLNGELKLTGTAGTIPSGNYFIGSWSSTTGQNFKGKVNDVRIYDHCLSPMEVKELAKGLVLHYPLNRQGWGQENLGNTSATYSNQINGQTISASGWGGDTGTVTCYHSGGYNNYPYKVYHKTATGSGGIYYKTANDIDIKANTTYTMSVYIKASRNFLGDPYSFNINRGSDNYYINFGQAMQFTTEWKRIVKTFTTDANAAGQYGEMSIIYDDTAADYYIYYSGFKIEEGSVATPWCPNSSDTLATTMGLNGTTEYDCSGFCNNGTRTGTFSWTSDTPKYSVSSTFGSTSTKIHISNFSTSGFGNSYSFAWWGKTPSWSGLMQWGFSDGIRFNGIYNGNLWNTGDGSNNPIYKPNTTTQITVPSVNVWHHYVMTGDGTTNKLYVDGELYGTSKTYKGISGTSIYLNGWDSGTTYCHSNYQMSDFRIYATALSADDVKSLYQNEAYIDSSGTIYGQIR